MADDYQQPPPPPPPPGWWQASDGRWYAPTERPADPSVPPPVGHGLPPHAAHGGQQPLQIPPNRFGQNVGTGAAVGCGVVMVLLAAWFVLGVLVLLL